MSMFSTPEPERPSDEHAPEVALTYPCRLLYRYVWLNLLFAVLLASNLCFPRTLEDLDME
jgi:hypothetical protein